MVHLLAISVCNDYLSKFINKTSIEQTFDMEEDTDKDSKNKSLELDDFDDEYLISSHHHLIHSDCHNSQEIFINASFQYLQIALPQSIYEILIPPPRA